MKILQVIDSFSPSAGGTASVACRLSQALSQRDHEITLYTSDFHLEPGYITSLSDIKTYAAHNYLSLGGRPLLMPGMLFRSRRELRDFDIIHLHNYPTLPNVMVHRYARQYNIPYVLQAHGSLATYFQKGVQKMVYDTLWGKTILKGAAKVIAVASIEAEIYRSMGVDENKIEYVPNGIDAAEFDNLPPRGEFRNRYDLEDRKIVLYLGRIHATKGLNLLVEAFTGLLREHGDALLVITGPDDGCLPALKNLIKRLHIEEKTIFTGPLYGMEKLQVIIDSDVFAMPSSYEIFGIAALEACLCGIPVVVTDCCGIAPEITADMGQVIRYDEDELRDALLKVFTAPEPDEESKEKRKMALLARFSWQKLAIEVECIYRGIVENHEG